MSEENLILLVELPLFSTPGEKIITMKPLKADLSIQRTYPEIVCYFLEATFEKFRCFHQEFDIIHRRKPYV